MAELPEAWDGEGRGKEREEQKHDKDKGEVEENGDCCKVIGLSILLSVWISKTLLSGSVSVLQNALKVSSTFEIRPKPRAMLLSAFSMCHSQFYSPTVLHYSARNVL